MDPGIRRIDLEHSLPPPVRRPAKRGEEKRHERSFDEELRDGRGPGDAAGKEASNERKGAEPRGGTPDGLGSHIDVVG